MHLVWFLRFSKQALLKEKFVSFWAGYSVLAIPLLV
jgi:hypothetical protein